MRTYVKVLIAVFVIGFVFLIGAAGAGFYWWNAHKGEYIEAARGAMDEGAKYGSGVDNQACLDEALAQDKKNQSFTGSIKTGLFLDGCLRASRETPGFCTNVPEETEFMKSATWRVEQCQKAGLSDSYCQQIVGQVQKYCHPPERK